MPELMAALAKSESSRIFYPARPGCAGCRDQVAYYAEQHGGRALDRKATAKERAEYNVNACACSDHKGVTKMAKGVCDKCGTKLRREGNVSVCDKCKTRSSTIPPSHPLHGAALASGKVRKLEDAIMGGKRTLGTALGIEKKKADESLEIHREGKVSFHASKGDAPIEARHEDHGVIATIHHDPTGKEDKIGRQPSLRSHPYGTHVLEPTGSLADEMGTERHNTAIDAMRSVAEHGNRLPSKAQIDSSLAHSEGGTDHHYGIASKYVTGSAFRAREVSNNLGRPAPDHVVQHKGWTHEYTDFRGSIEGRHIDAKGNAHYSRHPDARTGHEAHQQFEEGHGTRVPVGSGHQPHPQREYRDSSGVASHTYHAAHDGRPGFYGTHLSFFPNTSVAEAPRGDATAYGNSSSPNHDFHVSYHPTAKSHDEAHMQYLKARGVVKSADGGDDMRGADEIDPPALVKAAANGHTIPSIGKWNMYAGGTAAAPGKHAYDHYAPGGLLGSSLQQDARGEGIPGSHRTDGNMQYTIHPVSNESGRHVGYHLGVAGHPLSSGLHESLGMFNHPAKAAKAAREHYESKMPH